MDVSKRLPYILVVDDNPRNLQLLDGILRGKGYRVGIVENGVQAIRATEEELPDLILLDIMMPEMDGFETCSILKDSVETKDIPIIFLSAKHETEDTIKALEMGAVDYVTKPFHSKELLTRVKSQLDLKESKELILKINQERLELIHILCHDLVNPIGVSQSLVEDLDISNLGERKPVIMDSLQNGMSVINLVRKMQELDKLRLHLRPVSMLEAISVSIQMLKDKMEKKHIELSIEIQKDSMIQAEKTTLINSVLNNILTNAIKFSYPNSTIAIEAEKGDDFVKLSIRDEGMGMNEKVMEGLFLMGKGTSRPGTGGERGTGFGMPIVKKFMDAYGGSLEIFSKDKASHPQEHGTRVQLTFVNPTEANQFTK